MSLQTETPQSSVPRREGLRSWQVQVMADSASGTPAPATSTLHRNKFTVSVMVKAAIENLKEDRGSSLPAIKKYISAHYEVDAEKLARRIKSYLKSAVAHNVLVQPRGKGACGRFKLSSKAVKQTAANKPPSTVTPPCTPNSEEVAVNDDSEEDSSDSVIVCEEVVEPEEPVINLEALGSSDGEASVDKVMPDTADEEEPDATQEMNQLIRMKNSVISVLKDFVCVVCLKHVDHTFRLCEEFHFFCSNCKPTSCRICDKPIAPSRLHNDFNKLLKAIPTVCKYAPNGCRRFHDDNELCGFRDIACSKCRPYRQILVKDAHHHFLENHGLHLSMTKHQTLKIDNFEDKKTARAIYVFNEFFYFFEYFNTKLRKISFALQVFPIGLPKDEFFLTVRFENKNKNEVYEKTVKANIVKNDNHCCFISEPIIGVPFELVHLFKYSHEEYYFTITVTKKKDQDEDGTA